jgi:predicted Fe-Mo cluster-binding NifX family protein
MAHICITAKGPELTSPVEERFGRAPYFLIIDEEGTLVTAVENPHSDAAGGVGPRSAQILIDNDATILITGQAGGNAKKALEAAGIEVFTFGGAGSPREALDAYRENRLTRLF